jgi:hypothetical protein
MDGQSVLANFGQRGRLHPALGRKVLLEPVVRNAPEHVGGDGIVALVVAEAVASGWMVGILSR